MKSRRSRLLVGTGTVLLALSVPLAIALNDVVGTAICKMLVDNGSCNPLLAYFTWLGILMAVASAGIVLIFIALKPSDKN